MGRLQSHVSTDSKQPLIKNALDRNPWVLPKSATVFLEPVAEIMSHALELASPSGDFTGMSLQVSLIVSIPK